MILLRLKKEDILGEEMFVLRAIFYTWSESRRPTESVSSRTM